MRDLNNWGNQYQLYEDDRDREVVLAPSTDLTATAPQNATWGPPSGPNGVISAQSVASNCTYTIDVGTTGAIVSWPNPLPKGCSYSNPSTGIFKITGPITKGVWDNIKIHNVTYPIGYATANTITYTVDLLDGDTVSWDLDVTIDAVYQLGTSYTYSEDEKIIIYDIGGDAIGDPLIIDPAAAGKEYTVVLEQTSPTDQYGYWSHSGDTTPVLGNITITGNASTINSNEIFYTPPADYTGNINLKYQQYRYDPATDSTVHQITNHAMTATHNGNAHAEYNLPVTQSYASTNPSNLFRLYNGYEGAIEITDVQNPGSPEFSPTKTYSVTVENIGEIPGDFIVNGTTNIGNPGTITGNVTVVNSALSTLSYQTDSELSSNTGVTGFVLQYNQTQTLDNIVQAENVTQPITLNMPPELVIGTFYPEFGGIYIGSKTYNVGNYQEEGGWELFLHPDDLIGNWGDQSMPFRVRMEEFGEYEDEDMTGDYFDLHNGRKLQSLADDDGLLDQVWGVVDGETYYRYRAFRYCRDLTAYSYSDYYLPAIEELYMARRYTELAAIGNNDYWSSSPESVEGYKIWKLDRTIDPPYIWEKELSTKKSWTYRVAAIRRIPTYPGA